MCTVRRVGDKLGYIHTLKCYHPVVKMTSTCISLKTQYLVKTKLQKTTKSTILYQIQNQAKINYKLSWEVHRGEPVKSMRMKHKMRLACVKETKKASVSAAQ